MLGTPMVIKTGGGYKRRNITYRTPKKVQKKLKRLQTRVKWLNKWKKALLEATPGEGMREALLRPTWDDAKKDPDQTGYWLRRAIGNYKGVGDYGWQGAAFRGVGETLGSLWGHGKFGRSAGARISKWLGYGDYGGHAGGNQLMAGSTDVPITVNQDPYNKTGDVYISHREFVGNVQALVPASGLSTFNVNAYALNVGLSSTFPWLSQIATNFTLYELQGCIFEYVPTSGELGSTSNQLGKIIMATQYDPDALPFGTSVQMENYDYANACKPSMGMMHGVETAKCQRATDMLYVRNGPTPKDKIFTDIGIFQIATEGLPVTGTAGTYQNVGELWVTYRVKLSRAQLQQALGQTIGTDMFVGSASTSLFSNGTASFVSGQILRNYPTQPATNAAFAKSSNSIGCTCTATGLQTMTVTFPRNVVSGCYSILWYVLEGSASTIVANGTANAVNCQEVTTPQLFPAPASNTTFAPTAGVSSTKKMSQVYVTITAPGNNQASIDISWSGAFANGASSWILIEQCNYNCVAIIP